MNSADIFFVGSAIGRVETQMGEVERVAAGGVVTADGQEIDCDVIIKNFGFEPPDAHLGDIVGAFVSVVLCCFFNRFVQFSYRFVLFCAKQ